MEKAEIINSLVKEFGEEFKEEIETSLDDSSGRYSDRGAAGYFEADGTEYNYIESEDEANRIAVELVTELVESDPDTFEPNFLSDHVYMSEYDIRFFAADEADATVSDLTDEETLKMADLQVEAEEGTPEYEKALQEARDSVWEEVNLRVWGELLTDPIGHLKEMGWTLADALEKKILKIDYAEAAEEAVAADGWAHFLSHYDGDYKSTAEGLVYFNE